MLLETAPSSARMRPPIGLAAPRAVQHFHAAVRLDSEHLARVSVDGGALVFALFCAALRGKANPDEGNHSWSTSIVPVLASAGYWRDRHRARPKRQRPDHAPRNPMTIQASNRMARVLERLELVRPSKNGWSARCPAHDDKQPSLSITEADDGHILLHCHANCAFADIVRALDLAQVDYMPDPSMSTPNPPTVSTKRPPTPYATVEDAETAIRRSAAGGKAAIVGRWWYQDALGGEVFRVVRLQLSDGDKTYRPIHRGSAGWVIGFPTGPRPLYALTRLSEQGIVFVVEGEKCADAGMQLGLLCTTSAGGAEGAGKTDWSPLAGREVVIVPDNDVPGRKYACGVAALLARLVPPATVRTIALPDVSEKGDIADFIAVRRASGHADAAITEELVALATAQPHVAPSAGPGADGLGDAGGGLEHRPTIRLIDDRLAENLDQVEALLNDPRAPQVFQRHGMMVRIVELEGSRSAQFGAPRAWALKIGDVTPEYLVGYMARRIRFERTNAKGLVTLVKPPKELACVLLARSGEWRLPHLKSVVDAPQLLSDGRVLITVGYDEDSRLLFAESNCTYPSMPQLPSREDALEALGLLDQLLAGFAFLDDADRSGALALLLTSTGRLAFSQAPAFGVTAPTRNSGKSTLQSLGSILGSGCMPASISVGGNEDEADKRILSVLKDGHRVVSFDNLNDGNVLDTPAVARAITDPVYTGRPLGMTGTASFPTSNVVWTFGGVNIRPRGDMVSRAVMIRLDPQDERPGAHAWTTPDPISMAFARRGEMVVAGLTVLRAYILAGRPDMKLPPCRFMEWSKLVRSALVWLGRADPLANIAEVEAGDEEAEILSQFIEGWHAAFGTSDRQVRDVVSYLRGKADGGLAQAVYAAIGSPAQDVNPARLGRYLKRVAGRIVEGRRFVLRGTSGTRCRWALEGRTLAPLAPPSSTPREKTEESDLSVCACSAREPAGTRCQRCQGARGGAGSPLGSAGSGPREGLEGAA